MPNTQAILMLTLILINEINKFLAHSMCDSQQCICDSDAAPQNKNKAWVETSALFLIPHNYNTDKIFCVKDKQNGRQF